MRTAKQVDRKDIFIEAARKAIRKAGWSPRNDLEILKPKNTAEAGSVHYGYKSNIVRLVYSPELMKKIENVINIIGVSDLGKTENVFEAVVASRVYLQIGSFKVCPSSAYDYYEICQACADGLRSIGASEAEVNDFTMPVTSFFVASVVAGVYGIEGPDPESFRYGWVLDHIVSSITSETVLKRYVAIYTNIQLCLWSDNGKLAEVLRGRYPRPFDALGFETDRGISILLNTTKYVGFGKNKSGLSCYEGLREFIFDELKYNWRDWSIKAFQFAELLAPYIISERQGHQPPPQPRPSLISHNDRPSNDAHRRRNLVRQRPTPPIQNLINLDERPNQALPGTPFEPFNERFINDSRFREQLINIGIGQGRGIPSYLMRFDEPDAIYRNRATNIKIKSELTSRKGTTLEIAYLARKELASESPTLTGIDWGKTRVNVDGHIQLYKRQLPITDQTSAKIEISGFPDLLFIVDSSGSMSWDPQGGKGPYDSLLRAVYSVLSFLEDKGKAQHMRFSVVNFSGTTLTTPWLPFAELREIKKMLFKHQKGGTKLDCTKIQQIIQTSADKFLCLMITDAQISNAAEVLNTIRIMTDRGHGFVLIHIGKSTPLTQQVQQSGFDVHIITEPKQLCGLCLDYAQKNW